MGLFKAQQEVTKYKPTGPIWNIFKITKVAQVQAQNIVHALASKNLNGLLFGSIKAHKLKNKLFIK